jgi:uncharacterized membrane protein HdeD (DUF308 family)
VSRRRPRLAPTPRHFWTIGRASMLGIVTGIAAVLMVSFRDPRDAGLYPYAALLALTAFCGASVLWITAFDMRERGTSDLLRPVRVFDILIGLALLVPALYAFWRISGPLGLAA